jgi:membrane associated rhomboid family serine protease
VAAFLDKLKHEWTKSGIVLQIVIINLIVFFPLNYSYNFGGSLDEYFALSLNLDTFLHHPWTFISCLFSHREFGHIFFNMIWLWVMGRIFIEITGFTHWTKITFLYLFGGFLGNIFLYCFALIFPRFSGDVLGASDGVMAIAFAIAFYRPNFEVNFFLVGEIKIKWVVAFLFVTSTLIDVSANAGGKISHLGGAVFGMVYGLNLKNARDISAWFTRLFTRTKKSHLKVVHNKKTRTDEEYNNIRYNEESTLNGLLDKINRSGYESLSKKEKETLHILSKRK